MERIFTQGSFLLPKKAYLNLWPVIAVDQYTSQPAYWNKAAEIVGEAPSALKCILPEVYLNEGHTE